MSYTVLITPTALQDIGLAIEYYNLKATDLGYKFADEVEISLQQIAFLPKAYPVKYKDIRGKSLKRFPFLILYSINDTSNAIEVIRIFNTYQNQYWDTKK